MSKKISDFFKIKPKFNPNCELNQENLRTSAEVKDEKEADSRQKVSKTFSNPLEIRECRVILKDINKEIKNGKFMNLSKIESEPKNEVIKNSNKNKLKSSKEKCKFCDKNLVRNLHFNHMRNFHPEELKFDCKLCNLKFLRELGLKRHMNFIHGKIFSESNFKSFECDFDGKIFHTKNAFRSHMNIHLPNIRCKICDAELKHSYIKSHLKYFHSEGRQFKCKICLKSFKTGRGLKIHILGHDKKFKCNFCPRMFPALGYLNIHKRYYHEDPKSFECETCGKKFNKKCSLKRHQKTHDKYRPKPFKCQRCAYATDIKIRFKLHLKFHDRQDEKIAAMKNPIKCEKCSTFCKNEKALYQHLKIIHSDAHFQCDLCGRYFNIKGHLFRHIKRRVCQKTKLI